MEKINIQKIAASIFLIRGQKVMLDADLAVLYGVETKYLKRQVNRNLERFPPDFMWALTQKEISNLRCQIGTSSWGGTRYRPYAFSEHGILMLSSVLNSPKAIQVNISIMRVFAKIRKIFEEHKDLALRIERLEHSADKHGRHIRSIFAMLERLMAIKEKPKRQIGFHP